MAITHLYFGGVSLHDYFTTFTVDRPVMAEVDASTIEIPGRYGAIPNGHTIKPLQITVNATLKGHTREEVRRMRRALAVALRPSPNTPDGTKTLMIDGDWKADVAPSLVRPDDDTAYLVKYDAIVVGSSNLDRGYAYPHVSITFSVPEGCGHGDWVPSETIRDGNSLTITNEGNIETWPVLSLRVVSPGEVATVQRTHEQNTKSFSFTAPFGTEVWVDCKFDSVRTVPTGAAVAFDLESDFFELLPGDNTILLNGCEGTIEYAWRWA